MYTAKDIAKVNWVELGCPEITIWLTDMLGDDEERRTDALYSLGDRVIQTDLFRGYSSLDEVLKTDVHLPLLPFLFDFLQSDFHLNKRLVLSFLLDLASYIEFEGKPETLLKAQRLHDAVCQRNEAILPYATDQDSYLRLPAIHLLRTCSCDPILSLPRLLNQLLIETDHRLKLLIIDVIGDQHLQGIPPDHLTAQSIAALEPWLGRYADPQLQMHTALSLLKILRHDTPQHVRRILVESLIASGEWVDDFLRTSKILGTPKGTSLILDYIALSTKDRDLWSAVLALLDIAFDKRFSEALFVAYSVELKWILGPQLDSHIEYVAYDRKIYDPELLLNHFVLEEPATMPDLTPSQKQIIGKLVGIDRPWQSKSNVFYLYGLPGSRADLLRLSAPITD